MYLLLPLESLTSLLKTRDISKRKRWRSRPLRIRVFGSQTWNDSWRMSSPWDSMFSSNPEWGRVTSTRKSFFLKMLPDLWGDVIWMQACYKYNYHSDISNEQCVLITFQHREVHGIISFLRNAEHHLQAVLDLSFPLFAASQQLLHRHKQ